MPVITRRSFLAALAATAAPRALAQPTPPPIRLLGINHMTLTVTDTQRSLEFYQGLFGMPVQAWQARTPVLRVGSGPQFLALSGGGATATPRIDHMCFDVESFDVDGLVSRLEDHGLQAVPNDAPRERGRPLYVRVRMRGPEFGGAAEGTPELYLSDPDGIVVQLQDPTYCGGAGVLGECLSDVEPSPSRGRLAVQGYNHFTVLVADVDRSFAFYRRLFDTPVQGYQASTPLLSVGRGTEFLALGGGGTQAPSIHHACLTVDNFDVDRILAELEAHGVTPHEGGPMGPLQSSVTMRMPDRGGSPEGTPELYFTDPDGIRIQLQDATYCGGSGHLGDVCA